MSASKPLSGACFRGFRRRGIRLLPALSLLALLTGAATPNGASQAERAKKPDQVLWRNRRGDETKQTGVVKENGLAQVVVDVDGHDRTMDSGSVIDVVFGDVPAAYQDGLAYAARGDYANAAAKFQLAAGDDTARDVVKASARLEAAMALKSQGAQDPSAFQQALTEYQRFLSDFPDNREVPTARFFQARMQLLTGDTKSAAESYRALYKEAAGATITQGYSPELCFRAGLAAARCYLDLQDTLQAREIFAEMDSLVTRVLADVPDDDTGRRGELAAIQAQARLGEGYCLLSGGTTAQAKAFFQGQLQSASPKDGPLRNGARLGLAETLLTEGDFRQAELEFATVSAIDHTDPDRVARALVGLAQCALKLSDANAKADAQKWIQIVREHYGDTPAVLLAQELSKNL